MDSLRNNPYLTSVLPEISKSRPEASEEGFANICTEIGKHTKVCD